MKKVIWIVVLLILAIGIVGIFLLGGGFLFKIIGTAMIVASLVFFVSGFKKVQEEDRWIIEFFGKFERILEPGLRWVCPGLESVRAVVSVWEQTIQLFEKPIKIDFKDGSATPKEAYAYIKISDPYKAIYAVKNWRTAGKALLENACRSYLNGLTIEEGISMARAGYDVTQKMPPDQKDGIIKAMKVWGIELLRVTIGDFDLESDLVKARGELHKKEKELMIARLTRQIRAQETVGAAIDAITLALGRDSNNPYRFTEEEARRFAEDLVKRRMSIDGKALYDIRTEGQGGMEEALIRLLTVLNTVKEKSKK
ncbi:SPFH domain-containing protein [bacterium]|nr:SPFH domain-containing protein [bacterium]